MIGESVGFLREQGKRVIYDAEHFFDAWRDDLGLRARVPAGRRRGRGRERDALRHERLEPAAAGCLGDGVRRRRARRRRPGRDPHPQRRRVRRGQLARRRRCGRPHGAGHDERLRRALRQREPGLDPARPAAEDGLRVRRGRAASSPRRDVALPRRAHEPEPRSRPPLRRAQRLRPQGRDARRRRRGGLAHVRAPRSGARRQPARGRHLRALGQGLGAQPRRRGGHRARRRRGARSAVERLKEREHRGYHYEAADASFELLLRRESGDYEPLFRLESFRVLVEKRADGAVETEATIKIWVGENRYVRTAEGNGPVNALDRALRDAITDLHPHLADIELVNYKVRILDEDHGTGAVTRVLLESAAEGESWGTIGVSENIIEASWEALVESLEYAFQPRRRANAGAAAVTEGGYRSRGPTSGRGRRSWSSRSCARGSFRSGRFRTSSSGAFARALGVDDAVAVSSGHRGASSGCSRARLGGG